MVSAIPGRALAQASAPAARERALELFRESAELYQDGRFADAAARLRAARALYSEPLLAYNLARALESAGDLEGAIAAYHDYLREAPDARDAPAVRARLETLERQLAERRALEEERARLHASSDVAPAPEEPEPVTPSPSDSRGVDPLPWVVVGGGAAIVIAGGVVGALAVARNDEAATAPDHASAVAASDEASTLATTANVLFVAGGVAALAGVVWGTIDLASTGEGGEHVALELGPGSIGIRGTF